MAEWRTLSERAALPLFHELGVLWIHRDGDEFFEANAKMLNQHGVPFSRWSARELSERFPVVKLAADEVGFFEPWGGGLMARRAVQQLAAELEAAGVTFLRGRVSPIHATDSVHGGLPRVTTESGERIEAEPFVFACGAWLDQALNSRTLSDEEKKLAREIAESPELAGQRAELLRQLLGIDASAR